MQALSRVGTKTSKPVTRKPSKASKPSSRHYRLTTTTKDDKIDFEALKNQFESAKGKAETDNFNSANLEDMFKAEQNELNENAVHDGEATAAKGFADELIEETESVSGPEANMEFQTETRKILDIVARSIYSDKEVFIRELISNASDALEKVRYRSMTGQVIADPEVPLQIKISADDVKRTLIIQDTGIGMGKQELIDDLGRIGHSGTGEYLKVLEQTQSTNLIGQFGVGFYSTFMVAKRIKVYSRSAKDPDARGYVWISDGSGSYQVAEAENVQRGTKIIIELADNCEEFAKKTNLEAIIKKYSNFVGFDIVLNGAKVNTVKALWTLPANQITDADHKEFYQFISKSYDDPLLHIQYSADSPINVRSLFYVPTTHMEKYGLGNVEPGVSLFCRKVMIQAKSKNLLPEWLRFIKGVIDSEDIPLNISREHLQDNQLIKRLNNVVTRRILKHFEDLSRDDPVKYDQFYAEYNQFFKQGICSDVKWKEDIAKLLRFETSKTTSDDRHASFETYLSNMHEKQKEIYYLVIPSRHLAEHSPYLDAFKRKDVEVMFLYNPVDDFVMSSLGDFKGKKVVSIESTQASESIADLPDVHEEDVASPGKLTPEQFNDLAAWMRDLLTTRVTTVSEATRTTNSPCLVVDHESAAFRRMMKMVDPNRAPQTPKLQLQLNTKHPIIVQLDQVRRTDPDLAHLIVDQLMDNAMINAGILDDSRGMIPRLNKIMESALKK